MGWLASIWNALLARLPLVFFASSGGRCLDSQAEAIRMRTLTATMNVGTRMKEESMPGAIEAHVCGHLRAAHSVILSGEHHLSQARVLRMRMIAEAESRRLFGINVTEADSYALAERTMLIDMLAALMECRNKEGNLIIGSAKKDALDHLQRLIEHVPNYLYREAYTQHRARDRVH